MSEGFSAYEWFEKGDQLFDEGKFEEALEAYNKAIELDPDDEDAWHNKGLTLDKLDKQIEALEAYDNSLAINNQKVVSWFNKGLILNNLSRYPEALNAYQKVIELYPNDADTWFCMGNTLEGMQKYEESIKAFEKAIDFKPNDADIWYNKGRCFYFLGKYQESIDANDEAININPNFSEAWNNRGASFEKIEDYEEAIYSYTESIKYDSKYTNAIFNLAELYFSLGNIEESVNHIDSLVQIDGIMVDGWILKGRIEIEKKNYSEAGKVFQKAISQGPGNPIPLLWKAYSEFLDNEYNHKENSSQYRQNLFNIIRQMERGRGLFSTSDIISRSFILYFLGCLYFKAGEPTEAARTLEQCLKIKQKHTTIGKKQNQDPFVCKLATDLLDNIWNYAIKPPLWRWWLNSPIHRWWKRTFFIIMIISLISPISASFFINIHWPVYMFISAIILILLALPSIQRISAKGIDMELQSPTIIEPTLSPLMIEKRMGDLESSR